MVLLKSILNNNNIKFSFNKNYRLLINNSMSNLNQQNVTPNTENDTMHFKVRGIPHPLSVKVLPMKNSEEYIKALGDHTGRLQNKIHSDEDILEARTNIYNHKPSTITDHVANKVMYFLYHTFNFVTGYKAENPTVKSIEWRLIVLESVAGVPGFIGAGVRHFHSLRNLEKDHGWILTLLEEAENERMHLLTCLSQFEANLVTRSLVLTAQYILGPTLTLLYLVHPKIVHRFVGYLEQTAVATYVNIINHVETEGTHLNVAWKNAPAPTIAKAYWKLPDDAKWLDCLKQMMTDEAHHRDVNHTFASLRTDDPNPFVLEHKENAIKAWRIINNGDNFWKNSNINTPV